MLTVVIKLSILAGLTVLFTSCTTTESGSINPLSVGAAPFAITSPTVNAHPQIATLIKPRSLLRTSAKLSGLSSIFESLGLPLMNDPAPTLKTFSETRNEMLEAFLAPPNLTVQTIQLSPPVSKVGCFGPVQEEDTNADGTYNPAQGDRLFSEGDLGLWNPASINGVACTVAKINSLIEEGQLANQFLKIIAVMLATENNLGIGLPKIAEVAEATQDMPSIPDMVFSKATFTSLNDDIDGHKVFKSHLLFTRSFAPAVGEISLLHTPIVSDNTVYKGLLQVILPIDRKGAETRFKGMSLVYESTGSDLTLALEVCSNGSYSGRDFFNRSEGRIDFSKTDCGENANKLFLKLSMLSNEGIVRHAKMIGKLDDGVTQVFEAQVKDENGTLRGVGYYGYGPAINNVALSGSWITKFYPNWLKGGSNGASLAQWQGQSFKQDSLGNFLPIETHIGFVPTDTGTGSIKLRTPGTSRFETKTVTAVDLVAPYSLGKVDNITAPFFTVP